MITIEKTPIDGLLVITPKVFKDARGYFLETYSEKDFKENGLNYNWVQDNRSKSSYGVLRGLHFQKTHPQAKLVSVIEGEVFDVAVDLRKNSPTYLKWYGVILNEDNNKMFLIPRGFAHGFLVLSKSATFQYKCDDTYHPEDEGGIHYLDKTIDVKWPSIKGDILVSEKDKNRVSFELSDFKGFDL